MTLLDTPTPPILNENLAIAIVRDLVKRNKGMFRAYVDWEREDLEQEALKAVHQGWHRYNPKWTQSTFITVCGRRRLLSLRRDLKRRNRRDDLAEEAMAIRGERIEESTLEWFEGMYDAIKRRFEAAGFSLRLPKARLSYLDLPARMALAALHQRTGLSCRAFVQYLDSQPQLLTVLGLSKSPQYKAFSRLYCTVSLIQKKFKNSNRASAAAGTGTPLPTHSNAVSLIDKKSENINDRTVACLGE